jgi:hypothetical protein
MGGTVALDWSTSNPADEAPDTILFLAVLHFVGLVENAFITS